MKCPTCGENTPNAWKPLYIEVEGGGFRPALTAPQAHAVVVELDWMHCANDDCGELIIRVHEAYQTLAGGGAVKTHTGSWLARPRFSASRPLPDEVQGEFRRDYEEATAILDLSPRMSAVLSRKILADVLSQYAKLTQRHLPDQIDAFRADTAHPTHVRKPLHYLREIGNFGAHTQTGPQAEIIDVGREEAEWTLDVIDRLFDYFIVSPEADRKLYESMDEKLEDADRTAIPPLPDEDDSS